MPSSPVAYPLGPPSVSGNLITVDEALNSPTTILRDIADLATSQRFWADRVFSVGGEVSGGAVLFERPPTIATDLYAERDVQQVEPGDEFPLLTFLRGQPMVARPRKIGGKWFVTREARRRNDVRLVQRYIRQSANTIRRKIELMALAELSAVITAESRTAAGVSWLDYAALANDAKTATTSPLSDAMGIVTLMENEERGHMVDSVILNPQEWENLVLSYDTGANAREVFAEAGITNIFVTPRQTAGTALFYEEGAVGGWRNEFPLEQETKEEDVADGGRQRTWFQFSIAPVMWVDDQYALYQLTGLAA